MAPGFVALPHIFPLSAPCDVTLRTLQPHRILYTIRTHEPSSVHPCLSYCSDLWLACDELWGFAHLLLGSASGSGFVVSR